MEKNYNNRITVLIILALLFTVQSWASASEPAYYTYHRLYLPTPDAEIAASHIVNSLQQANQWLKNREKKKKSNFPLPSLQIRITVYTDALHGEMDTLAFNEFLDSLVAKIPVSIKHQRLHIAYHQGKGWFSPLEDIHFLILLETNHYLDNEKITYKRYIKDLVTLNEMSLKGRNGEITVNFTRPRHYRLLAESHARVAFHHSEMLDPRKSSITLLLNRRGLKTTRLDASNAAGGEIRTLFPVSWINDYNSLTISAGQLLAVECTPPFDPSLWTSIEDDSYIYLSFRKTEVIQDLAVFPYPFFDELMPLPENIFFFTGGKPNPGIFSRYLELSYYLGGQYQWRRGDIGTVKSLIQWETQVPGPLVAALAANDPLVQEWAKNFSWETEYDNTAQKWIIPKGKTEQPGILKIFTLWGRPVLLISGNDTASIERAFEALSRKTAANLINSRSAQISYATRPHGDERTFPLGKKNPHTITLGELGIDTFTLRGGGPDSITLDIPLIFGSSIPSYEGYIQLEYSYSAQSNTDVSSIEILVDDIPFSSIPVEERDGITMGQRRIQLPHQLISGRFPLTFHAHFYPVITDPCKWNPLDIYWFTVFDTSRLELPRDIYLEMPELKWFRLWGYPFVDNPDFDIIRMELEEGAGPEEAALNLAFFLGQKANRHPMQFIVDTIGSTNELQTNTIRIFTRKPDVKAETGNFSTPLLHQQDLEKIYINREKKEEAHILQTLRGVGFFEELPLVDKKAVLLNIQAHMPDNLKPMVKTLSMEYTLEQFYGAALVMDTLAHDWLIKRYTEPKHKQKWGSLSSGRIAKQFFLDNLVYILLGVPLSFFLIYVLYRVIKYYIRRSKRSRVKTKTHNT